MKITSISPQVNDQNRVNISIDGKYRLSLDLFQLVELSLKVGLELNESDVEKLDNESRFGKAYARALEYCLMRPRSKREVKDYLYRKSLSSRGKDGNLKQGLSADLCNRVFDRLIEKSYIDDFKFAKYWVENRYVKKGLSLRKLTFELKKKGVDSSIIDLVMVDSQREDESELQKIIHKKSSRYPDKKKFAQYLNRQGFNYDDIKTALDL